MPIFRSIRWRLVAGFTLLTVLTVTLLGVLVLSLMQRYVIRQETAYLNQNATALAKQSQFFFTAPLPPTELTSLVRTASLLGNFRVKIFDANEEILVDSAASTASDQMTWVVSSATDLPAVTGESARSVVSGTDNVDVFVVEAGQVDSRWHSTVEPQPSQLSPLPTTDVHVSHFLRIIRQNRGEWGPLLHFEMAPAGMPQPRISQPRMPQPGMPPGEIAAAQLVPVEGAIESRFDPPTLPNALPSFSASGNIPAVTTPPVMLAPTVATATSNPTASTDQQLARLFNRFWSFPLQQQVVTPIQRDAGVVGYVELSSNPGVAVDALAALQRLFIWAAAAVSLIAVGVGLVMSRGLTAPLRALTLATGHMNAGDLTARAQVHSADEIGQLAASFNRMADALETSFAELAAERDALRHFVADASHELRTPITALRTFTELLQTGAANDPAVQAEFLTESGLQVQRLERITESLLNLSRLDGGLVELQIEDVPIDELLPPVIDLLRPLALERKVTLTIVPLAADLIVRCDYQQMERALTNLIENALKFTPVGGQVHVGATAGDSSVELWVQDNGIGIAPAEQSAIFRRFYRGQKVTNQGSGLGLSIVQSIVQAHGGTVTVASKEGQGSRFTINISK